MVKYIKNKKLAFSSMFFFIGVGSLVMGVFLSFLGYPGFGARMTFLSFWFLVSGFILFSLDLTKNEKS